MMAVKWDFEVRTVAAGINVGFKPELLDENRVERVNPYDRRPRIVKTPEQLAELAAGKQRLEDIRRRVNERKAQRETEHGSRGQ